MTSKVPHEETPRRRKETNVTPATEPPGHPSDWGKPLTPREVEQALFGRVTDLLGGLKVLRLSHRLRTPLEAHEMLRHGLPVRSVGSLISGLSVLGFYTEPSLEKALGVSVRTVQRNKKTPEKRLSLEQSGRVWKFAEILAKATEVFGSQHEAEQWMERPAMGLDQRRPIDLMATPAGADLVENFLGRLEYGVYT